MDLQGRLICISGSADPDPNVARDFEDAHRFIAALVPLLLNAGANLLLGEIEEKREREGRSIVFDWTALEAMHDYLAKHQGDSSQLHKPRATVLAPMSHLEWIEGSAKESHPRLYELWCKLVKHNAIDLQIRENDPSVSAQIYKERSELADAIIVLGGGAGTALSVLQFQNRNKLVIPFAFQLGARTEREEKGTGWNLSRQVLTHPEDFFPGAKDYRSRMLSEFLNLSVDQYQGNSSLLAERTVAFLQKLHPPADLRRIFISHGGSSEVWQTLRWHLHKELKLEVEEFNQESVAGHVTVDRLKEMLNSAVLAFIVMTGEDEDINHKKHARENVIHEAGLFQGKLGFERAILLLEEGCEKFSNAAGLTHIPFRQGIIKDTFDEIRRVLIREGLIAPPDKSGPHHP